MSFFSSQSIKDPEGKKPITTFSGHVEYAWFSSDSKKDKKYTIKFGGFSTYGTGWYIRAKGGGGLSWQLKCKLSLVAPSNQLKDATTCPPMGDWDGYGAVLSCVAGV